MCEGLPKLQTQKHVLILQHPQEPDKLLGTARLAHLALPNSTLKIGLSWPNLRSALGREADPSRWAVLYLGSGIKGVPMGTDGLELVSNNAEPLDTKSQAAALKSLEGIVILDGTWSQAKALWWRNPWLLKLRRAILNPKIHSQYGELRREPRSECLSTIETIAEALNAAGEPAETAVELRSAFSRLLEAYRLNYARKKLDRRKRWRRR